MCKWMAVLAVLIAGCVQTGTVKPGATASAPAAKQAEDPALAEWKAAVKPISEAKTEQDATAAVAAAKPKLQAIAEKNPKSEAGAQALRSLILYTNDDKEREGYIKTLNERFPTHPAVKEIAALQEMQTLLEPMKQVKSEQEALTMWKKLKPGLLKILEKNPNNEAGKRALVILLLNSGDNEEEQQKYSDMLTERFIDDPFVRMIVGADGEEGESCKVIGTDAKDFTSATLDGKTVKLSDYKGKVVLVDFFASWCGPCRAAMPELLKTYDKYHAKGLEVIGVSLDETADKAKAYVAQAGIKWTVAFQLPGAWDTPVAKLYNVQAIPMMLLIGKDGKIIGEVEPGAELNAMIEKALAEKAPEKK